MSQTAPRNSIFFSALVVAVLLFSVNSFGQSIGEPVLPSSQECAGTSIDIRFTVTNGSGNNAGNSDKYFLDTTEYIVTLNDVNRAISYELLRYTPGTAPTASGDASKTFSTSVNLPNNLVYSNTYQISVNSVNPAPQGNKIGESAMFEILPIIQSNTLGADQFGCNPYTAQPISGSLPTGGDGTYTYLWESSTTGPSAGFSAAAGTNTNQDYDPGNLTETTWFRRTVSSGACSDISESVKISITNDNIWTGVNGTDWNNPSNWDCNAIPISVTNVIIPSGLANYPILSSGASGIANNLNIATGASLEVTGNSLNIKGSISADGNLNAENGTVEFSGSAAQTIPAGTFLNNKIANLSINNPAGASLLGDLGISGYVFPASGALNSNGFLKLLSDGNQTALIDASGTGQVTGTVTMQRYLDSAFGYKYISSPFSDLNVSDLEAYLDSTTTFSQVYRYNENRTESLNGNDATGWEAHSGNLDIAEAYAFNFGSDPSPETIEISGIVNNGAYSIELYNHNRKYTQGFNLVGNPYPSPIDWDAPSGWTKDNIDDGIYFFTASNTDRYGGTYTSYVNGIQSADGKSSNIIPSMQGFFVHVSDPASGAVTTGTLGMTNEVRTVNFSQPFIRMYQKAPESKSVIRLKAGFEDQETKDATVVYFSASSHSEFEKDKDALKLMNTDIDVPSLFSLTSDKKQVSINGISVKGISGIKRIPLGLKADRSGWMNIELGALENISSGLNIYLIDNEKRKAHDLRKDAAYKFTAKQGSDVSRFELVFSEEPLKDPAVAFNDAFSVETRSGLVQVHINLENGENGLLRASNMSGQMLDAREVSGKQTVEIQDIQSSGIYLISLQTGKRKYSRKIIIRK